MRKSNEICENLGFILVATVTEFSSARLRQPVTIAASESPDFHRFSYSPSSGGRKRNSKNCQEKPSEMLKITHFSQSTTRNQAPSIMKRKTETNKYIILADGFFTFFGWFSCHFLKQRIRF
jgi:hypothetical protein